MELISIYHQNSLLETTSNFIMLKVFHDKGVDVASFKNVTYETDINSENNGIEILEQGLQHLFDSVRLVGPYYDQDEELHKKLGEKYYYCDHYLVITDTVFKQVLLTKHKDEFMEEVKKTGEGVNFNYSMVDFKMDESGDLIVLIEYAGILHETLNAIIDLLKITRSFLEE